MGQWMDGSSHLLDVIVLRNSHPEMSEAAVLQTLFITFRVASAKLGNEFSKTITYE